MDKRLLKRKEAAAYCNMCATTFSHYVTIGMLPKSIPVIGLYDRKAIDLCLDAISGLSSNDPDDDPSNAAYKRRQSRKSRGL
ncbi:hypothetical protein [Cohaesibacter sp. ES.047]|uniref:hypothetical protein n=1 Tax=Cohaesibacter sp. ES.047 TaxID=1798205 RepID=UPI0012FDB246|nr:hypothetical protein [Cohaesibacter sp. ES.047]